MPLPSKKEGAATAARTSESKPAEKSLDKVVEGLCHKFGSVRSVQPVLIVIDKSGSMEKYHIATGKYLPVIIQRIKDTGLERSLDSVYLAVIMIAADGLKTNGWQRLRDATDVEHEVDGGTPIGAASSLAADMIHSLVFEDLVAANIRAKPALVLKISDLQATETEQPEVTKAGIEKLVAVVKKARGQITVVGPTPEETDQDLARMLSGPERKIRYLGDDPSAVITVTFDTLTA